MNTKYVSPKGSAGYPKLTRPDTKFNAEGIYSTQLTVDKKAAENFMAQVQEAFTDEFGSKLLPKANWPWTEEEGKVVFKFKSKQKPKLYDSNGKPIKDTEEPNVGSGSTLKVSGAISCRQVSGKYYATLYMNHVQIINLVEWSGSPFDKEEGDFVADDDSADVKAETEDEEVSF